MILKKTSSLRAHQEKLRQLIVDNSFGSREELLTHIKNRGWFITRDGRTYLGILVPGSGRFQLKFEENSPLIQSPKKAKRPDRMHTIYLMVAIKEGEAPRGYVGSTSSLMKRLRSHNNLRMSEIASWELQYWAAANGVPVLVRVLDRTLDQKLCYLLEGCWTDIIEHLGFALPGAWR